MKAISSHPSPSSSVSPLPPSPPQPSAYLHTALMPLIGLLPCRLNNPNSFIFLPRWCFPNLWSLSLPFLWTPSSWLLTVLYPKLGAEPLPSPADGVFQIFSQHIPEQWLFCGKAHSAIPLLTATLFCKHRSGLGAAKLGLFPMPRQGCQQQGGSPGMQGREGKATSSAQPQQHSSRGKGEQDTLQAGFFW